MGKCLPFVKKNLSQIILLAIFLFAFFIRIHNIRVYTTWWADDGGGHVMYIESLLHHHRLPSMNENYLAWHEPGYYAALNVWTIIIRAFHVGDAQLNWQETTSVAISLFFLFLVWKVSLQITNNRWVSLVTVGLTSVLFVGVKLAGYLNNELPVQAAILGLGFLFVKEKLLDSHKEKQVALWSVLLAFALLIKLTAVLVFLSVLLTWTIFGVLQKKKYVWRYVVLSIFIVSVLHTPWLIYKQREFGSAFTINLYEEHKQSLVTSDGWKYLFRFNAHFVTDYPYWFKGPHSFASILIADTFSDYYNLFHHWDAANGETETRILVMNGLYTVPVLWRATLWMNRLGLVISASWLFGCLYTFFRDAKERRMDWYRIFWYILVSGGYAALLYNNLRHPYLERGVLKALFIYYVFPLTALCAYEGWWKLLKHKWLWAIICVVPIVIYTIVGWPILYMMSTF